MAKLKPVCKFFLQGQCAFGDKCRYRHEKVAGFVQAKTLPVVNHPGTVEALVGSDIKATLTSGATATRINLLLETDPALRIVDIKSTIEVLCYLPTRNVWFHFRSLQAAHRVRKEVDRIQIHGFQLLGAVDNTKNARTYSLQISNIPDCVSDEQLQTRLKGTRHAMAFIPGKPSYATADTNDTGPIRRALSHIRSNAIESICMMSSWNPIRLKAEISYDGSPRLDGLAQQLDGTRIPEYGNTKLRAFERVVVRFRLRRSLYEKHVSKLKLTAAEIWKDYMVPISIDDSVKEPVHHVAKPDEIELVMKGTTRPLIAAAKARLDRIFTRDMTGHLTGAPRQRQTHRIRLTKTKAYKQVLTKITDVQKELGEDVVRFDEESDPPAIVVHGDTAMLRRVQTSMNLHLDRRKPQCAICEDNTDDVLRTRGCNHIACRDCFLAYCTTDIESKLPLRCFASECGVLIPLEQLRSSLSKEDLKHIIDQAAYQGLQQNVDAFGKCPGINCEAHFPLRNVGERHVCPKCFTIGCPTCRVEYHWGETCEAHARRVQREGLRGLELYMETMDARFCPNLNCRALVEKAEGCNNMQCLSCKVHFCWVCMHTEDTHGHLYRHLMKAHGGYFDEDEEALILDQLRDEEAAGQRRLDDIVAAVLRVGLDAIGAIGDGARARLQAAVERSNAAVVRYQAARARYQVARDGVDAARAMIEVAEAGVDVVGANAGFVRVLVDAGLAGADGAMARANAAIGEADAALARARAADGVGPLPEALEVGPLA